MIGDTVRESMPISATPEAVFDLVTDLPQIGRFSLENTGGKWIKGAHGPAIGARLKGRNRQGRTSWSTTATVMEYDSPRTFSFAVTYLGIKVSRWTFVIEPQGGGVTLTQSWCDERPSWFAFVTKPLVADRLDFTRQSIHHTLTSMKTFLES